MTTPDYHVHIEHAEARPIAAVRARMRIDRVPSEFTTYLNQVYAASRAGSVSLDGQNIFVYRDTGDGDAEVDFGVGTRANFPAVGAVTYTETPAGRVATTTHLGDYGGLSRAHAAVIRWCKENGHQLAGLRWEIYGHWSDNPAKLQTDVLYLLAGS